MRVSGRCWGEKLFRRVVTKTYTNQKGEAIVKDLLDYFAGISHVRNSVELVEDTDTTYTKLEYENTPVWDILKYVAESSDKQGVIGYDFRVAPDGKFEFFPKNSKSSSVSLSEKIEGSEYRKDIHRVRNKVMIYGIADKSVPLDKDAWTESLTPTDGVWSAGAGVISFDTSKKAKGTGSIKLYAQNNYYGAVIFTLNAGKEVNCNLYPIFELLAFLEKAYDGNVVVQLFDTSYKTALKNLTIGPDEWRLTSLRVGVGNEGDWESIETGFDWTQVKYIKISCYFAGVGTGSFWVDGLYFGGRRYAAVREDAASQSVYGLRELTETDEELWSDNECDLRAKALLAYLKDPAEYLTIRSTVIDYGTTPLLAGDKIHVVLPNENVDADFRNESVEYRVDVKTQTLEITLELGKVPPMLADYLYGLRTFTVNVEKLSRTKLGKKGIPRITQSGGIGSHHVAHEAGDNNGNEWPTSDDGGWDKIMGWVSPRFLGPYDDSAAMIQFRTRNKAGTTPLQHQFVPMDDGYGVLGSASQKWYEINTINLLLTSDGFMRIRTVGEANPMVQLNAYMLQFGPGGALALDTWLKRIGSGQLELKYDLLPTADNSGNIGSATKRFAKIYVVEMSFGSHLLPDMDAAYDIGSLTKRWSNLYLSGLGSLGWLNIGGYTVITDSRVLQNVTAAAAIITSGRFPLARLPDGVVGSVLEGQGGGSDPAYVDPNYRYMPKSHDHAAETLNPTAINCNTMSIAVGCNRQYAHPSAQQCVYASSVAWENCPRYYAPAAHTHSCANSGVCGTIQDLVFANNFRITEAEKLGLGRGLAFLNQKNKILMVLTEDGDLHVVGRIKKGLPKKRRYAR